MNLVNKTSINIENQEKILSKIPIPINSNLLLENFKTQLFDWRNHLLLVIDDVDNKSVLIFDALFVVELWLKLIIIEKLSLLSYSHLIEECGIHLDGRR